MRWWWPGSRAFRPYAGILALALIVIPVVIRTTENMLYAGACRPCAKPPMPWARPKWKVILAITLRAARAGVITGVLLAVARIAGETAPLLFTALNNQFWNGDLSKPMASLPVTIFKFAMSPYENWQQLAWAGVFLITVGRARPSTSWPACSRARNKIRKDFDDADCNI